MGAEAAVDPLVASLRPSPHAVSTPGLSSPMPSSYSRKSRRRFVDVTACGSWLWVGSPTVRVRRQAIRAHQGTEPRQVTSFEVERVRVRWCDCKQRPPVPGSDFCFMCRKKMRKRAQGVGGAEPKRVRLVPGSSMLPDKSCLMCVLGIGVALGWLVRCLFGS